MDIFNLGLTCITVINLRTPVNLPSMGLLKFSDISTDKIYVVELCSIHFLVLVCEGLHEINSSDMKSVLSYISCKASVKKTYVQSQRLIIELTNKPSPMQCIYSAVAHEHQLFGKWIAGVLS